MRRWKSGVLSMPSAAAAFAASSLISMIADMAAARRCSAGRRANCWSRSLSASSRSASVTGWPSIVASTVSGAGVAAGAGAGAGASSARPAAAPNSDKGGDCQHADKLAAQQVGTHRRVSGGVGICIGIRRGNGRIRRRCERCCNVDIGSAPSYLSFVFASRTDFWRLWLLSLPSRTARRVRPALPARHISD